MVVSLKGDKDFENVLSTVDKALRINLNEHIYGTLSGGMIKHHFLM